MKSQVDKIKIWLLLNKRDLEISKNPEIRTKYEF